MPAAKSRPHLVLCLYIRPPRTLSENVCDTCVVGKSGSGWMKSDVFYEYKYIDSIQLLTHRKLYKVHHNI